MYQPTGPNVLIRRIAPATQIGSIVVPESAQKPTNEGIVAAVGKGTYTKKGILVPLECHEGDRVIWSKYQGTEIKPGLWLVREDDILGREPANAPVTDGGTL